MADKGALAHIFDYEMHPRAFKISVVLMVLCVAVVAVGIWMAVTGKRNWVFVIAGGATGFALFPVLVMLLRGKENRVASLATHTTGGSKGTTQMTENSDENDDEMFELEIEDTNNKKTFLLGREKGFFKRRHGPAYMRAHNQ
jgi:hypothetical protein